MSDVSIVGKIRNALVAAFPTPDDLELPIQDIATLDSFEQKVAGTNGYGPKVAKYVEYAHSQGRLFDLLRGRATIDGVHIERLLD